MSIHSSTPKSVPGNSWSLTETNQLREMKASGHTYKEIADAIPGRSVNAIRNF
ncbi:hypothetical protein LY78DRAFT_663300 [Colletotrichum sublineola]|nr:hypothetical protein LY78DRAFT_663300 [Colletotrichum sublineola]